jgi:hypothetical protein
MANPRSFKDEVDQLLSNSRTVEEFKQEAARNKCNALYQNEYDNKYKFSPGDSVKTPNTELNKIYNAISTAEIRQCAEERVKANQELDNSYRNRGITK